MNRLETPTSALYPTMVGEVPGVIRGLAAEGMPARQMYVAELVVEELMMNLLLPASEGVSDPDIRLRLDCSEGAGV